MNNGTRFWKALVALRRAYRSLATFGPDHARRARALAALRALRAAVDTFPVPIVRKKGVRLKTFEGRVERLRRAGWRSTDSAQEYAAAGVPVRRVAALDRRALRRKAAGKNGDDVETRTEFFVPAWAAAIGHDKPSALRAAKGNLAAQREALAVAALGR